MAEGAGPQDSAAVSGASSPIADLTYRNYDGPLLRRSIRWWTIALAMFRMYTRPLAFRVVAVLALIPYLFTIILLYFQGQINSRNPGAPITGAVISSIMDNDPTQKFALQFYNALGYQLLYLLILTIIAGAGSISSDNRNNALLIYLSKPITKLDYLTGKWVGLFMSLYLVAFVPALMLYFYCLVSFAGEGFLHNEPRLLIHIVLSTFVASMVLTSIMLGISAWSKTPRITGALMAGLYFATQATATVLWGILAQGNPNRQVTLLHSSVGGLISGLTQGIYGVTVHVLRVRRFSGEVIARSIAPPSGAIMLLSVIVVTLAGVAAARAKIRAVEVIG